MSINRIDLSALPFPQVLEEIDFEVELQECKNELVSRDAELEAVMDYESEPLVKLLETFAYRLLNKTAQINAKAKALMLAYATGSDLDHLAANRGVYRLTIIEANPNVSPPIEAVMESDEALRRRTHLQPEAQSAGSVGAYQFWGLSAHGHVKDIAVDTPQSGHVDVWVQSYVDEIASLSLLKAVDISLDPVTCRPLTDEVTVKAAIPYQWSIAANLVLFPGPDADVVKNTALDELNRYIHIVASLGYDVTRSGIYHALHVSGVQNVILVSPTTDIILSKSQYAKCIAIDISTSEFRDV